MSKITRVLVTGCCGFIGSNLLHSLHKRGWQVDGVDDMSNGHLDFLHPLPTRTVLADMLGMYEKDWETQRSHDEVLLIQGDFVHDNVLSRIRNRRYDYIFHLAANPRVSYSVEKPVETTETNVMKTITLFSHSIGKIQRLIFSSSSAVYGDVEGLPTLESVHGDPQSPYGLQKKVCEQFADMFCALYDIDIVCLRYFNVYGPRQFGNSPYSTAVSAWCHATHDSRPLRSDGDGQQSRDMVFVGDVVDANILAAQYKGEFKGKAYNIATGDSHTNNEILQVFISQFPTIEIDHAPHRPGDVKHTLADISKAHQDFGYVPQVKFKDGLSKTLKWWELGENNG
jgi:UDP-glucose 4-epimerase